MLQAALKQVLRNVLADFAPVELSAFDIESDAMLGDVLSGTALPQVRSELDSRFGLVEAGAIAISATVYMKLISATVAALKDIRSLKKNSKPPVVSFDELKAAWATRLSEAGISRDKAESIAARFSEELFQATVKS